MSLVNKTRFLVQDESCESKSELNKSVCNSKQKRNHGEYQCECKELDDWSYYTKMFICRILVYVVVSIIRHVKLMNV